MEDFGGISLGEWAMRDGKWGVGFLKIAIQIAGILKELNRNRVIHKDIKPANILINPETKQVKLIDFSIASLLPRETQQLQNPNVLEGTLAYISPEQTGRMNRGIDYRSDFYSLGVTFYELLTRQLPFVSDDAMELVHCHIAKQAPKVNSINPNIPEVISNIIALNLLGRSEDPCVLSGEALHEEEFLPRLQASNDQAGLHLFYLYKFTLCFLQGDMSRATENAVLAKQYWMTVAGTVCEAAFYFYDALIALATYCQKPSQQDRLLQRVDENLAKLQHWAPEIELEQLLSTLMHVVLENAGATKSALMLLQNQNLVIEVTASFSNDEQETQTTVLQSIPIEDSQEIPHNIINYVKNTLTTLLIHHLTTETNWAADAYIQRSQPKSSLVSFVMLTRLVARFDSNFCMGNCVEGRTRKASTTFPI